MNPRRVRQPLAPAKADTDMAGIPSELQRTAERIDMDIEKEITKLIAKEVSWFNGWTASDEMFDKSCRNAARKVIKRLKLTAKVRKVRTGKRPPTMIKLLIAI